MKSGTLIGCSEMPHTFGMRQITTSSRSKVGIVGGGIGGLSAALALLRRGIDVEVYEQSHRLKEIGAGVQIGSNGTRVLYALGLEDALSQVQVLPARREIRHWRTGETWNWFELGAASVERFGTPHLMLHRIAATSSAFWQRPYKD